MIKGRGGSSGTAEEDAAIGKRPGPDSREVDERKPASGGKRESFAECESNLFSFLFPLSPPPPSSDSV